MVHWNRFAARFRAMLNRKQAEEDLAREIDAHLALLVDDFEHRGMTPHEARIAALRTYGGVEQAKQAHRDERVFLWADQFMQDLRYCLRSLKRSLMFTVTAVLVLALGIGCATAMFVMVYGVFIRPLPYPNETLLFSPVRVDADGQDDDSVTYDTAARWRRASAGAADIALTETPQAVLDTPAGPLLINNVKSTVNLLETLSVQPALGRGFAPGEAVAGRSRVALLSYSIWHDSFLGDPRVLGRSVYIDGEAFSVIGVMPPGFLFPVFKARAQVWTPLEESRLLEPPGPNNPYNKFSSILRIHAGIAPLAVQAALSSVRSDTSETISPGRQKATQVRLVPFRETVIDGSRFALKRLEFAVALLWFIAGSNFAGLLLARIAARHPEIAIRGVLGAGSARIVKQFLTESLLLSFAGASVGAGLAMALLRCAGYAIDRLLPVSVSFGLDWIMLSTLMASSVCTAIVFGAVPAAVATRVGFAEGLRAKSQATGTTRKHRRFRELLVVCEVGMTLTLVVASLLMIRTLASLKRVPLGFRTDHIVVSDLTLPGLPYKNKDVTLAAWQPLLERVQHLPGVSAAALSTVLPITHSTEWRTLIYKTNWTKDNVAAEVRAASPSLMQVLGIHILTGRFLTDQDVQGSLPVAVVNQAFVSHYLGGGDPVGKQIRFGRIPSTATIVGVLEDIRQDAISTPSKPEFYISMAQLKPGDALYLPLTAHSMQLGVRTQTDPNALVQVLSRTIHVENPQLIVGGISTMDEAVEDSVGPQRLITGLVLTFGGFALVITCVGIYGLLTYIATQRTREIGIRIALGADRSGVMLMILKQSLKLMAIGLVIGMGASYWAAQLLKSFLFGVGEHDLWSLVLGSLILLTCGIGAAFLPAKSAALNDPMRALRSDT